MTAEFWRVERPAESVRPPTGGFNSRFDKFPGIVERRETENTAFHVTGDHAARNAVVSTPIRWVGKEAAVDCYCQTGYQAVQEVKLALRQQGVNSIPLREAGWRLVCWTADLDWDAIEPVVLKDLLRDWQALMPEHSSDTQKIGQDWLADAQSLALRVPSVVTPHDTRWNVLIKRNHPDFHANMFVLKQSQDCPWEAYWR